MTIVTRFAPSPTGSLHIGGARTALFNWLYAKKNNGLFKLRIEDTDKARSNKIYVDEICKSLKWLKINWDLDLFYQSKNINNHLKIIDILLKNGYAYKCYCTKEEIEAARNKAISEKKQYKYNRKWRDYSGEIDKPFVIRIKIPLNQKTELHDKVLGTIKVDNNELEDFIILRTDKTPTYMLSVVVDDYYMGVTDIIRGDDHLTNSFKQIVIYNAMKWNIPRFAHIPLIHGNDGAKLSKRHGASSVIRYKEMGILPDAINNYLLRLGWGYKDKEIFSLNEAISLFNINGIGKSSARFDQKKLDFLNAYYLRNLPVDNIKIKLEKFSNLNLNNPNLDRIIALFQKRAENYDDIIEGLKYMLDEQLDITSDYSKSFIESCNKNTLNFIIENMENLKCWNRMDIEKTIKSIAKNKDLKIFDIIAPIRAGVTGKKYSPSIYIILEFLGKDITLERLKKSFSI